MTRRTRPWRWRYALAGTALVSLTSAAPSGAQQAGGGEPRAARPTPPDGSSADTAARPSPAAIFAQSQKDFDDGRRAALAAVAEVKATTAEIASQRSSSGFLALPVLFYGPETDLGFGAFGMYYFRPPHSRTSSIRSSVTGTTRGQALFDIGPDLWLYRDFLHLEAAVSARYFPDTFVGIGNDTPSSEAQPFTERSFAASAAGQLKVAPAVYVGIRARIDVRSILDVDPASPLATVVTGGHGGLFAGGGPFVTFDDRDNVYATSRGTFATVGYQMFPRQLGGDYAFSQLRADFRHYIPVGDQVIALQAVGQLGAGTTPFYALSRIGGTGLRGIRLGRFVDNNMFEAQAEFRFPIFGRIGGAAFIGAGQVARSVSRFAYDEFKPAGGGGLRYAIVPAEKINIRLDFAYSYAGLAYYLDLSEAF
jgi:hypothetical protein